VKQKVWKPEAELVRELQEAAEKIEIGTRYAHFRHPEQHYTVMDIIWDTTTEEPAVLYQAQYGSRLTFSRPVRIWLETVEVDGKTIPRFTKVRGK
jgi:hypothetical protein